MNPTPTPTPTPNELVAIRLKRKTPNRDRDFCPTCGNKITPRYILTERGEREVDLIRQRRFDSQRKQLEV